ncbi:MAG: hypothetical protein ACKV2T_10270 [Kofleriaceae bacterium]
MKLVALVFVSGWVVVAACGGQKSASTMAATAGGAKSRPATMLGDPRNEIDRLAKEIDDALAGAGVATLAPSTCEMSHSCTAEPFGMPPRASDPACKPPATDTCTQSCTLSDSVCANADKICTLAKQLGGADDYANEKCQSANDSCKRTRDRCCGCS